MEASEIKVGDVVWYDCCGIRSGVVKQPVGNFRGKMFADKVQLKSRRELDPAKCFRTKVEFLDAQFAQYVNEKRDTLRQLKNIESRIQRTFAFLSAARAEAKETP